jgi:uncharacterized membrane protein HdeD (DUF308 family)
MSTAVAEDQMYVDGAGSLWWIFLITGTLWLILSIVMFRFNITSVNTLGILAGIVFLIAGVVEFGIAVVVHGGWWKALNALLGVVLVVGGITAFVHPGNVFVAIASITGFMFLFVGIFDLIAAFSDRTGLWWVRMITGFICIGIAFWASGDFSRKSVLLITWIGLFALMRGIASFVIAFSVRNAAKEFAVAR